jgi:nucleolar protein 56
LKTFLVASELGLLLLDEAHHPKGNFPFPKESRGKMFLDSSSGIISEPQVSWLKSQVSPTEVLVCEPQIAQALQSSGFTVQTGTDEELRAIRRDQMQILVDSGLAASKEEAEEAIREVAMEISNLRIKEMSSSPDLQAMESVQALDELDKTANVLSSRLREWYGLHFPEITSLVDDNISLAKLVVTFKSRENYEAGLLEQMGYSKNKSKAIETAAKQSRGTDLRESDLARIVQLAEEAQHLFSLRDKVASHVEKTMREVAPNLTEVAGATIGARLIAKAGGLRKLAILPASTIQILGAEKALYRALKSGARPPKHGILFQHAAVHSAPKWQRGKIARSVAGKIAIAARVDTFRGSKDESVMQSLQSRLEEIRQKYKEPPRERKEFVPQARPEFRQRERGPPRGREKGRSGSWKRHGKEEKRPRRREDERRR